VYAVASLSLCATLSVQPVEATWSKQRALWLDLIRQYAAHHGLTRISLQWLRAPAPAGNAGSAAAAVPAAAAAAVAAAAGNERDVRLVNALFRNDAIDRQCALRCEWASWRMRCSLRERFAS
jgi:hypothetical protein